MKSLHEQHVITFGAIPESACATEALFTNRKHRRHSHFFLEATYEGEIPTLLYPIRRMLKKRFSEGVREELMDYPNFIVWKSISIQGKTKKLPLRPIVHKPASSTVPQTRRDLQTTPDHLSYTAHNSGCLLVTRRQPLSFYQNIPSCTPKLMTSRLFG
jgi:hypothetical protein